MAGPTKTTSPPETLPAAPLTAPPAEHVRNFLTSRGADPSSATPEPNSDVGDFEAWRITGAGLVFASTTGLLDAGGSGDWQSFLLAADPAVLATRLAATLEGGHPRVLGLGEDKPAHVSEAEWALVGPPTRTTLSDGTLRFRAWMGSPPAFGPFSLTIIAPPAGRASVVRAAAHASLSASQVNAGLLEDLVSDSSMAVKNAAEELGERGDPAAVLGLVAALSHRWVEARKAAAMALAKLKPAEAATPLGVALATETDVYAISELIGALNAIGTDTALQILRDTVDSHPVGHARDTASAVLGAR